MFPFATGFLLQAVEIGGVWWSDLDWSGVKWSGVAWSGVVRRPCAAHRHCMILYDTVWLSPPKLTATHEKRTPELGAIVYPCSPPEVVARASPGGPQVGKSNPQPNPPMLRVRGVLTDQPGY